MKQNKTFNKIAITGTKGKTTIARLLDFVLISLKYKTLRVDTDGHYVNGKQKSNYFDARKYWGMVPNNCPGRYLFELRKFSQESNLVAILEAAIGSSSSFGLGYAFHDIGIITNIYDDHITNSRIKNRDDIYKAKKFILDKTSKKGVFIFNSDDEFLTKKLQQENIIPRKIAVGKDLINLDLDDFFKKEGILLKIEDEALFFQSVKKKYKIVNFRDIPFSFEAKFEPNVYNISFVIAGLIALLGEKLFELKLEKIKNILIKYSPAEDGGRLVFLENKKKGIKIIIDFAHEKESFRQIALLAKKYSKNKVRGVLRIDPSRIDEDIRRTARYISNYYDFLYIYDKVDGISCNKSRGVAEGKRRCVGETAFLFAKELENNNFHNFDIILNKEMAFKKAYNDSNRGDTIVFIGDGCDHKKEIKFVKKNIKNKYFFV